MKLLGITVVLGLLAGVWAQINVVELLCESPEAEEAALAAQDFLNAQHAHGYKYALNRIEDFKAYTKADGNTTFVLEVDLLETDCHVLDPTPVANCTVRPKVLTAVEGDCDLVMKKVGGVMTVTAFKCKTEESTEDLCLGCPILLPLNDTMALDFVHASLVTVNNMTENMTFALMEVGRMSAQVVSGGPSYSVEYVVVEANCTDDHCVPLDDNMATRGFCTAKGLSNKHSVDCKIFPTVLPDAGVNGTVGHGQVSPVVASKSTKHGLSHHKLTALHDPHVSGLLSKESLESAEVPVAVPAAVPAAPAAVPAAPAAVPAAPAADPAAPAADPAPVVDAGSASDSSVSAEVPLAVVKRDVPAVPAAVVDVTGPITLVPRCPGRVRFF